MKTRTGVRVLTAFRDILTDSVDRGYRSWKWYNVASSLLSEIRPQNLDLLHDMWIYEIQPKICKQLNSFNFQRCIVICVDMTLINLR